MHGCHEHHSELINLGLFSDFQSLQLIATLFVTGLVGSFTHCIGMCGPIAVSQMSIRLIGLANTDLTQKEKIKCALTLPYYIGKAIAYALLGLIAYFLMENLSDIPYLNYIAFGLIVIVAILFFQAGLSKSFIMLNSVYFTKVFENFINIAFTKYKLSTYGMKGIVLGFILGLIPCGLVYGSIVLATTYAKSVMVIIFAMLAFGLATIPGLFIVSYFGSFILTKFKRTFNFLYTITMFLNAFLLIRYALKMI